MVAQSGAVEFRSHVLCFAPHKSVGALSAVSEHSHVRSLAVILSVILCSASAFARVGIVRTLDGRTFEGQIRITPEQIIVVSAERGQVVAVGPAEVSSISFPMNLPGITENPVLSGALPAEWRETDIGHARIDGSTRHERGTFTVRSAGLNIDGERDSFHYVYKPVRGDCEIIAQVTSIQYTYPSAKAGLMMRQDLGDYSRNVMIALTAMTGGALQFRPNDRANTDSFAVPGAFAPQWLKLRRRGNEFSAFISQNGRVWSLIEKVSMAMDENFYVGLAVASAQDAVLNWTTFSRVRAARRLMNEDFTPQLDLISGSVVTGRPLYADKTEMTLTDENGTARVPTSRIARVAFAPLGELAWKTRVSRPGVWVSNGDFFDGEFRGIENRKLTISSVLYGLRTFDIDDEVLALVMQPRKQSRAEFEVETTGGWFLHGSEFALGDGEIKLSEGALGEVRVPAFEIIELRRR
jgi:hypothetical protein